MIKTILLADDSLTIQKVVELTFADTQYHVVSLSSGDELLEKLPEVRPELVICDIIMPGRDGYDVCQEIKSNPDTLHIPVILLSGTFEPFDRDRALAVGCSEIVTKPFEAKRLVDAVDKLLSSTAQESSDQDDGDEGLAADSTFGGSDGGLPEAGHDFGTQLAASETTADTPSPDESPVEDGVGVVDDGIDFTTSGFADMEAAAETASTTPEETSADDLHFPKNDDAQEEPFGGDSDEEFADAFSEVPQPFGETADPDADGVQPETAEPFGDEVEQSEAAAGAASDAPFVDEPVVDPLAETFESVPPPAAVGMEPDEVEPKEFDFQSPEGAFREEPAPITTDADTAPVPPISEDTETDPVLESGVSDTSDVIVGSPLSDEDVDRIARRLLELATDRIEQVAWEVIPDVAEVAVRDRIRQLEAEFETEN